MIEAVAEFLVHAVGCVLFAGTGQAIMFVVSLGRYRPDWSTYAQRDIGFSTLAVEAAFWIGAGFWFGVGFIVSWLLFA